MPNFIVVCTNVGKKEKKITALKLIVICLQRKVDSVVYLLIQAEKKLTVLNLMVVFRQKKVDSVYILLYVGRDKLDSAFIVVCGQRQTGQCLYCCMQAETNWTVLLLLYVLCRQRQTGQCFLLYVGTENDVSTVTVWWQRKC